VLDHRQRTRECTALAARACGSSGPLRTGIPLRAREANPLSAGVAFRTRRTLRACCARRTLRTRCAG
jgi:hypothetical protein